MTVIMSVSIQPRRIQSMTDYTEDPRWRAALLVLLLLILLSTKAKMVPFMSTLCIEAAKKTIQARVPTRNLHKAIELYVDTPNQAFPSVHIHRITQAINRLRLGMISLWLPKTTELLEVSTESTWRTQPTRQKLATTRIQLEWRGL